MTYCWALTNFCFRGKSFWESFWDHRVRWKEVQVDGGSTLLGSGGVHMSVV